MLRVPCGLQGSRSDVACEAPRRRDLSELCTRYRVVRCHFGLWCLSSASVFLQWINSKDILLRIVILRGNRKQLREVCDLGAWRRAVVQELFSTVRRFCLGLKEHQARVAPVESERGGDI